MIILKQIDDDNIVYNGKQYISYKRVSELLKDRTDIVTRCKDCEYSYDSIGGLYCTHGVCLDCEVEEGFFCAWAERRQE